jgi:hypothetical protein
MIAAMANFLKYDVYDLELTQVILWMDPLNLPPDLQTFMANKQAINI